VIYCVVPRELEADLFERLTAHYADNADVEVIVDRRRAPRRSRTVSSAEQEQRVLRDRRRRRVIGELVPMLGEAPADAAA
jgi:hypothetical protein